MDKTLNQYFTRSSSGPSPRRGGARVLAAAAVIGLVLLPVATAMWNEPFYLTLVSRILVFGLAALGLNLVLGYGGMVSFGHALYLGIGAYAVGILADHGVSGGIWQLVAALSVGLVVSAIVGLISLRTSGLAFIMITLAFAQMFYFFMVGLRSYGGSDGLAIAARSTLGPLDLSSNVVMYYLILGILLATMLGLSRLVHSRFGIVLRGTKSNERRMRALGFPTLRYKLAAYIISAQICVVAGMLLANLTRYASPSYMQWSMSGELVVMAVLGGMATLAGPVLGAAIWLGLEEILSSFHLGLPFGIDAMIREHWLFILGALIVVMSLTFRQGFLSLLAPREGRKP